MEKVGKKISNLVKSFSALSDIKNSSKRYRLGNATGIIKAFTDTEEEEIINLINESRKQNFKVYKKNLISYASSKNKSFSDK